MRRELHALPLLTEGIATLAANWRLERRIAAPGKSHVFAIVVTAVERANARAVRIDTKLAREARGPRWLRRVVSHEAGLHGVRVSRSSRKLSSTMTK
jgi:hypothetical protein